MNRNLIVLYNRRKEFCIHSVHFYKQNIIIFYHSVFEKALTDLELIFINLGSSTIRHRLQKSLPNNFEFLFSNVIFLYKKRHYCDLFSNSNNKLFYFLTLKFQILLRYIIPLSIQIINLYVGIKRKKEKTKKSI